MVQREVDGEERNKKEEEENKNKERWTKRAGKE